jgi:hypothetical protein
MAMIHSVVQGDSMASLAKQYGFIWEQLWEHPNNAELKALRKNPNVLLEGDTVFIPNIVPKTVELATEQRHRFRRKGIPSKISLQLLDNGKPRAGVPYEITLDDGTIISGVSDEDGYVKESVQPERTHAVVRVDGRWGREQYEVQLGHLDPVDTTTGVQQRLANLGRDCEITGALDEQTMSALRSFQSEHQLEASGTPDDATHAKLLELCGA